MTSTDKGAVVRPYKVGDRVRYIGQTSLRACHGAIGVVRHIDCDDFLFCVWDKTKVEDKESFAAPSNVEQVI